MQQKKTKIVLLLFLVSFWLTTILFFGFNASNAANGNSNTSTSKSPPIELKLQQPFGGLSTMTISGTSIGEYIQAIYKFGSAAIVGLAIVMVIVSGIEWILAAGDSGKITSAKDRMIKAFTGLFIALFAVFMLRTISPATVTFKSITPEYISAGICCEKSGVFSYTKDEASCISAGGIVADSNKCLGGSGAPPPPAKRCGEIKPNDSCQAKDCATLSMDPGEGPCNDPATPNCCRPKNIVECGDGKPACPTGYYCAVKSSTEKLGNCQAKMQSGLDCRVFNWDGSGSNENWDNVCIGKCHTWSTPSASWYFCVPQNGQGISATKPGAFDGGDHCSHLDQCVSRICYDPWEAATDEKTTGWKNTHGICVEPQVILSGWVCEDANAATPNSVDITALPNCAYCKDFSASNLDNGICCKSDPGLGGSRDSCKP